jgi:two-component system chemotaxis response regulator CheB
MSAAPRPRIRVLVVEDSRVIAEFLTHVLNCDPQIHVVAVASNGAEAVQIAREIKPDVITMDIHMPGVNGFEATRQIMETCPAPIVIVSGSLSSDEVATNFRAIEAGALAVVARPNAVDHADYGRSAKELTDTVKLMSEVRVVKRWPRSRLAAPVSTAVVRRLPHAGSSIQVAAIGASTGGPIALQTILARLPKEFALPILIVQHMTPGFAQGFVEWLGQSSRFPVRIAIDGEPLLPGHAYLAPDDAHMGVRAAHRILLAKDAKEHGMRPSVSFLFRSVEQVYGANATGILLTGMGKDGVDGLKLLHEAGAVTIAQDEASCVVYGMPGEAILIGAAKHVLAPAAIADALSDLAAKP